MIVTGSYIKFLVTFANNDTFQVVIAALIPVLGPLTLRYTLTTGMVEETTEKQVLEGKVIKVHVHFHSS